MPSMIPAIPGSVSVLPENAIAHNTSIMYSSSATFAISPRNLYAAIISMKIRAKPIAPAITLFSSAL